MSVLLTGATGRIGVVFARRLAEAGVRTRAFVRETSDTSELDRLGVERVVGRFDEPEALARAAGGCDVVYHLAVSRNAGPAQSARAVNVEGTERLARAAADAGVGRLVLASTLGVYGLVTRGLVDESRPLRPNTAYRQTKAEGEAAVRRVAAETGLPVTVARIPKVIGAGCVRWAGLFRVIQTGTLRLVGNGANRIQPLHNEDVVEALIRCGTVAGAAGETYVLAGREPVSLRDLSDRIAEVLGVAPPPAGPPAALHRAYLAAEDVLFRRLRWTLPGAHKRELFVLNRVVSTAKAERGLGFAPTWTVEAAVRQMAGDFRACGLLPA